VKIRVKITGKVHNVGYRVFLTNLALELGMERFSAFNSSAEGKEVVIALLDADEPTIKSFRERIEEQKPEKAVVDSIVCENYTNDVPPIDRAMQAFQMEQWGKAIPIMVSMLGKQDVMIEKQDKMLGKQDVMIEKQDETIKVIKGEGELTRRSIVTESDKISSKIDRTNDLLKERFDRIEKDIDRIKRALVKAGIEF